MNEPIEEPEDKIEEESKVIDQQDEDEDAAFESDCDDDPVQLQAPNGEIDFNGPEKQVNGEIKFEEPESFVTGMPEPADIE